MHRIRVLCHPLEQPVAEVNKQERGLDSTETEVKIQARGLGFSSPNPLRQPLRDEVRERLAPALLLLFRHTIPDSLSRNRATGYSMKIAKAGTTRTKMLYKTGLTFVLFTLEFSQDHFKEETDKVVLVSLTFGQSCLLTLLCGVNVVRYSMKGMFVEGKHLFHELVKSGPIALLTQP